MGAYKTTATRYQIFCHFYSPLYGNVMRDNIIVMRHA